MSCVRLNPMHLPRNTKSAPPLVSFGALDSSNFHCILRFLGTFSRSIILFRYSIDNMPAFLSFDYNGGIGFRLQIGEWAREPNFLLQTSRTLRWYGLFFSVCHFVHCSYLCRINLPPDLLELCRTGAVRADTVRHFALGLSGKWYFEHVYGGKLMSST
jgi:hypothetical protein